MAVTWEVVTPDNQTLDLMGTGLSVEPGSTGMGMPPLKHIDREVPLSHGAILEDIWATPRRVSIPLLVQGASRANLHTLIGNVYDHLRFDRTSDENNPEPARLRYGVDGTKADLKVFLEGVVEEAIRGHSQRLMLRLQAYDPFWYATSQSSTSLTLPSALAVTYIVGKIDGAWSALGAPGAGGAGIKVRAIAVAANGTVYVGGNWTSWGGDSNKKYIAKYNPSTGVWSALKGGLSGEVYDIAIGPDGMVYVAGAFTTAYNATGSGSPVTVNRFAKYNPSTDTWSALTGGSGTGANGQVNTLRIAKNGAIYLGGAFTQAGGVANTARIASWNGSNYSPLGTGMDDSVADIELSPNHLILYAAGAFRDAGGVTVLGVAQYDIENAAWSAMGDDSGLGSSGEALAVAANGNVYLGGGFNTASFSRLAMFNGQAWVDVGGGANDTVYTLEFDDAGILYAGGAFTEIGGITLPDKLARWNQAIWSPVDIDLPASAVVWEITHDSGDLFLGFDQSGNATRSNNKTVTTPGSALTYPTLVITGPGTLESIRNEITGKEMLFNLYINDGETVTIDLSPGQKTVTSDWRGNLLGDLLPNSDLTTFALVPAPLATNGDNKVSIFIGGTSGNTSATIKWYNRWWSMDEAVS